MQALLAQLESVVRDPRANVERAVAALDAHPDVALAVFPELFLSAYDLRSLDETALDADGDELAAVANAAARTETAVVIGFAERLEDGFANSVACIDADGSLAGVYRKVQLFAGERKVFQAGTDLLLVELAGLVVAPLVCFDVEFPELARTLAAGGAELFAVASANMEPYGDDHELATRARALDNRRPLLYANAVGELGRLDFVGRSRSVDASGRVLAEAGGGDELLVVPVGPPSDASEHDDYLRQLPAETLVVVRPARR